MDSFKNIMMSVTFHVTGVSQPSLNTSSNENTRRPSPEPPRQNLVNAASTSQINEVLRRQMSSDIRNRGPPPQPPTPRNNNVSVSVL